MLKLTCATFSPIFGVCLDPWKYFAEPLSWNNRTKEHKDTDINQSIAITATPFSQPMEWNAAKHSLLFDLICSRKAHLIMMNCHSGRCCCSPNSVGMVSLCSVANHFRMTHTENTDERHDPIYLKRNWCDHHKIETLEKSIFWWFRLDGAGTLEMNGNEIEKYIFVGNKWTMETPTGQAMIMIIIIIIDYYVPWIMSLQLKNSSRKNHVSWVMNHDCRTVPHELWWRNGKMEWNLRAMTM